MTPRTKRIGFTGRDALRDGGMHRCHNPNCGKLLPAKYVCHPAAWKRVPKALRDRLWAHYRPGQENDKRPTGQYLEALEAVVAFLRDSGVRCFPEEREAVQ